MVPGVPGLIDTIDDGHAPNLEHWCHAAFRLFYSGRENLLAEKACGILPMTVGDIRRRQGLGLVRNS